ncbi:hypothetical protein WSM22_27290 [Cytophagales bacterium WSM2-2]|nr:hypothetical protein WSM22_27290 [Cytophagales bacterium WSM2-2]
MKYFSILCLTLLGILSCSKSDKGVTPSACSNTSASAETIQIFPATHPLNTDISAAKKDSRSDNIITFLASGSGGIKADFGSGLYNGATIGIPFVVVCDKQPKVQITFQGDSYDDDYGDESDPGPYPIPTTAPIEGNGAEDSHVIAVDVDNKKLYELYNANVAGNGWQASAGAVFDLTKEVYRPAGWTSADAAGLPVFPCLVRYDEVASGEIDHAIRFTLSKDKCMKGYLSPARHLVNGSNANSAIPTPMGMRLRLRANFDVSTYSATNQVILKAMKKYGIILADIGTSFYVTGAPDSRWDNDDLQKLKNVKPADFEVVEMGTIVTK